MRDLPVVNVTAFIPVVKPARISLARSMHTLRRLPLRTREPSPLAGRSLAAFGGRASELVAAMVMASVVAVAESAPQTHAPPVAQDPEKIVQGQVRSIDPAGTAITLTDGTRLLTPPGSSLRPGALSEGMTVIASYREQNGEKVMTELAVEEPSASPPADPRLPATPPTAPPRNSPPRY